jgi:hypothetical protein
MVKRSNANSSEDCGGSTSIKRLNEVYQRIQAARLPISDDPLIEKLLACSEVFSDTR